MLLPQCTLGSRFGKYVGMCVLAVSIMASGAILAGAQDQVTITYLYEGGHRASETTKVHAFEQAYPNIKVVVEPLPWTEFFTAIETKLAGASDTPDVFEVDVPLNASYAVRGFTMPLDDYLKEYPDLLLIDDYPPSALEASSYNGKIYSLPICTSIQIMYFNRDLFTQYGVEPPGIAIEERLFWKDVVEKAKALTVDEDGDGETDVWGFAFDQVDRPYQMLALWQSLGQRCLSPDGLIATGYADSPKSIQAGKFYYDLYNTWKVAPKGFGTGQTVESFGAGKIAMFIGGPWSEFILKRKYPDCNWDVAPHPYFEGGKIASPTGCWQIGVNPNSKHKEEAVLFATYTTSPSMAAVAYELGRGIPVRESIYELYDFRFSKHWWSIAKYDFLNNAAWRPLTPGYREWELSMERAYASIRGGVEPQEALSRAAATIDRQLKKYVTLVE